MSGKETAADSWDGGSSDALFKFDKVGDSVTGLLLAKKFQKGNFGEYMIVNLLTKEGEIAVMCSKGLSEELKKPQYQDGGKIIVQISLTELKDTGKGNPFKAFSTRFAIATEQRLAAHGIKTFDGEGSATDEEIPM